MIQTSRHSCREHQRHLPHQGHEHALEKGIIAQLFDEHLDRLSQIKSINYTNFSGLLRFEFVSVLAESDLLFKANCPQTLEVKADNKRNDTIAQHHMLFIIHRFILLTSQRTRPSHAFGSAVCSSS